MRLLLSILLIMIAGLIVMMLLPVNVMIKMDIDYIYLRINWIFKIKIKVEKLMTNLSNPNIKKSKTKMDKAFLKGILLRELRIVLLSGNDDEKLLYINSILQLLSPYIRAKLEDNRTHIYYKGRVSEKSWLEIKAKLIICPIYILSIYISSRRKRVNEEKRTNKAKRY